MIIKVPNISFSKNDTLRKKLASHFDNCCFNEEGIRYRGQELINFLQDADAAIVGLEVINEELLEACPKLKIISKYGVGLNNIDQSACLVHDVKLGWTSGVNRRSVSEMTLGFMLMLSRNLYATSVKLQRGQWFKNGGFQLSGKNIGIIGLGNIGKDLVALLKPFECTIRINDIVDQSDYCLRNNLLAVSKQEIYATSDIITVHTPLTTLTENLISEDTINKMLRRPILINTARGGIFKEMDLINALKSDKILAYGLDVYESEPDPNPALLEFDNVVTTPHIGGNSKEAVLGMGYSAIDHLKEYFKTS